MRPGDFEDLLGCRWEERGRGPRRFDCVGLAMEWSRRAGIDLKDPELARVEALADMGPTPEAPPGWHTVEPREAQEDDVVVMSRAGAEAHVVVMLAGGKALHCSELQGVCFVPARVVRRYGVVAFRYHGERHDPCA
jgi:hypothetical protein